MPPGGLYSVKAGNTNKAWALVDHRDPTEKPRVISVSYGLNGWQFPETPRQRDGGSQGPSHANVFTMRHTARIPLLLDCTWPDSAPTEEGPPPGGATGTGTGGMRPFCVNRHSGYVNCLFLDWSVRKVGLKELWTLKWHEDFDTAGPWTRAGGVRPEDWPAWMRGFKDY
jgi:prepilin-type processing-associated H-X9-DG protein